jgi:hypothetical protein
MAIRYGVGRTVFLVILAITQAVVFSQGRGGAAAPAAPAAPSAAGRFVDNGDETVTDTQTGLMWEKKTTAAGSGTSERDIRDVDNIYTWEYAMTDWLDRLNGRLIAFANDKAFASHSDWRIPTMEELNSIQDPQAPARINAVFGAIGDSAYWSSSRRLLVASYTSSQPTPWYVAFRAAEIPVYVGQPFKLHVRAVRNAR